LSRQSTEIYEGVMDEVDRGILTRRGIRVSDYVIKLAGAALVFSSLLSVLIGPALLSSSAAMSWQVVSLTGGAAFGLYLARRANAMHLSRERAYTEHLEKLSQRLRNMAYRDAVTGLYNHRYFQEQLAHEVERSIRYGQPLSLILLDMNNFKQINDRYGHTMGDRFLGLVGEVIDRHIRASDVGARYGGDEFVVVLPSTPLDEAQITAQKLAEAVAGAAAMTATGEAVRLSISFGAACCPYDARSAGELIERADARLYEEKARRKAGPRSGAA
jgi:diguanylate cyclase (GGDEF)-like protein